MGNQTIIIPKQFSKGEELVVVRRQDFEQFQKWNKGVQNTLAKVERGRKEYRSGKTSTKLTFFP